MNTDPSTPVSQNPEPADLAVLITDAKGYLDEALAVLAQPHATPETREDVFNHAGVRLRRALDAITQAEKESREEAARAFIEQ